MGRAYETIKRAYEEGYTKGIDDFAEALRLKCLDSVYKDVGLHTMLKIAEQLKEGGSSENID